MANQSQVSLVAIRDELCNWEFIDRSDFELADDSDYDLEIIDHADSLSFSDPEEQEDSTTDLQARDDDAVMGSQPTNTFDGVNCERVLDLGHHFDVSHDNFSNYAAADLLYGCSSGDVHHGDRDRYVHHDDNVDDEDDEGESDYGGSDVDDEQVPWAVKDRFVGRPRMRKLGKRPFAKMTKSKKSALIYTRPGCVRGKHGLGLKAY